MSQPISKPCEKCELLDASCIGQEDTFNPQRCIAIMSDDGDMECRVCGCTKYAACPGGCWWVEPGLCSKCAEEKQGGNQ